VRSLLGIFRAHASGAGQRLAGRRGEEERQQED